MTLLLVVSARLRAAASRTSGPARSLAVLAFALVVSIAPGIAADLASRESAPAQYFLDKFGFESGLPSPYVLTTLQTRDGYLWVGTQGGLARFDGVRFVAFRASNCPAFASNSILCLLEDRAANLWIGTDRGVVRYHQGKFEQVGLMNVAVTAMAEDKSGRIWIGTNGQGLYSIYENRLRPCENDPALDGRRSIYCLLADSSDRLWIGFKQSSGLVYLENGQFHRYDGDQKRVISDDVQTLCESPRGTLWFGLHITGLLRLKDGALTQYTAEDGLANIQIVGLRPARDGGLWIAEKNAVQKNAPGDRFSPKTIAGVSSETVAAVCEDLEGNLWISETEDGLVRAQQMPYRLISSKEGLPSDIVRSVSTDETGNIWLAMLRGPLTRVAPDGTIKSFTSKDGLSNRDATIVYVAKDGAIWIASSLLHVIRDGRVHAFPELTTIRGIYEDRQNGMWFGTDRSGLLRYSEGRFLPVTLASGAPIVHASSFCESADGSLYIGTWMMGLIKLRDGHVTVYNHDNGLPSDEVRAVHIDKEGLLWVGLRSRGLAVLQGDRWLNPTSLSEAVADQVSAIVEDEQGGFWLGTPSGVVNAPRNDLLAIARGERSASGLRAVEAGMSSHITPAHSAGNPTVWKTADHKILFATQRGVVVVDANRTLRNEVAPPVRIEQVSCDDRAFAPPNNQVSAPAGTRRISIEYTALSFVQPGRVLFKYKLEGYDPDWVDAGVRRAAFYTNLRPGTYAFRVKACNNDGVWNDEGAQITIVQLPHFYETRWFYGMGFATIVALGWALKRWSQRRLELELERLEQKQAMEKERRRIARNLHDDLGANLTGISLFAEAVTRKVDAPEVRLDMLALAERVRNLTDTLDTVVWTVNPANDSLDRLAIYLCSLRQDLFRLSSIRCRLDVAPDIPPLPLTPDVRADLFFTAKEALNNIIKHSGATEAWLNIKWTDDWFIVSIEDNGRGFDPSAPANLKRNGLANMRSRIAELGGIFSLKSTPGQGTSVTISMHFHDVKEMVPAAGTTL